jgi:FAD/FMN-containing dehydrogenase
MSSSSVAYVYRPVTIDAIVEVFEIARHCGKTVTLKGAGNSYGDAFQNAENIVIDLSRMKRILEFDPITGIVKCEPGVTIQELWHYVIGDGWWPPVVSGTSHITLGGALAANIHGKNNLHEGTIGEHVLSFDLLTANGEITQVDREVEPELFYAVIGSFGLLGVIVSATLQLKRVYSGYLDVQAISVPNFDAAFEAFHANAEHHDYIVAWIDAFASGPRCGRGLIHIADYLKEGDDAHPEESLRVEAQKLPDTVAGWIARSRMWKLMRPWVRPIGMRIVNWAKYTGGKREHGKRYRQSLAAFNFLLDSAPNWKWSYRPGGLVQYQPFIPMDRAKDTFERIITLSQDRGMVPFLAVMKRHRSDSFLLSHAVDGFSLALDYKVTNKNRENFRELIRALDEIVFEAGGKFYFAKDSTLQRGSAKLFLGEAPISKLMALKQRLDPDMLLQSDLSRRIFGEFKPLAIDLEAAEESQNV